MTDQINQLHAILDGHTSDPAVQALSTLTHAVANGESHDLAPAVAALESAARHENRNQHSDITRALVAELRDRDRVGVEKYGKSMDRPDLLPSAWLQHMIEEHMDALQYAKRLKGEIERFEGLMQLLSRGYFLGGPTGSAIVFTREDIEPAIAMLGARTGDDPADYTATLLNQDAQGDAPGASA